MSERNFHLNGYIPMPISGPCFVTPLFKSHNNLPWLQQIDENDKIINFSQLDLDSEEFIHSHASNKICDIGDEAIYGFRFSENTVLLETRAKLRAPLLDIANKLEERPHTKKAIEKFTNAFKIKNEINAEKVAVIWDHEFQDNLVVMAIVFTIIYHNTVPVLSSLPFSNKTRQLNLIIDEAQNSNGLICILSNKPKNNLSFEIGLYLGTQRNSPIRKSPPLIFVRDPDIIQNDLFDAINRVYIKPQIVDPVGAIISTRDYLTDNLNKKPKEMNDIVNGFNRIVAKYSLSGFMENPNLIIRKIQLELQDQGGL